MIVFTFARSLRPGAGTSWLVALPGPLRSLAVQAAGGRRHPRGIPPAPALGDPSRDRLRVGARLAAQACSLTGKRLVQLTLGRALEDVGDLGQQVGPTARELPQCRHRGGFLVRGELASFRVMLCLAVKLGDEDTVSLRALIWFSR